MAPFSSYLRSNHRRAGSTPSSDSPRSPLWKASSSPFASAGDDSARSPSSLRPSASPSPAVESPVSPLPPVLPPIPRVASKHEQEPHKHTHTVSDVGPHREKIHLDPPNPAPPVLSPVPQIMTRRLPGNEPLKIRTTGVKPDSGYRRREPIIQLDHPEPLLAPVQHETRAYPPADSRDRIARKPIRNPGPPPSTQNYAPRPNTPPSMQPSNELHPPPPAASRRASSPASSLSSFQKSISSSIIATDSSPASSRSAQTAQPAQPAQPANPPASRTTKPRMNLLNPVSLLRRRRTAQNVELLSESTLMGHNRDVPAMSLPEDYDPRIKGKGVHDFSAPRPRRHHSTNDAAFVSPQVTGDASPVEEYRRRSSIQAPLAVPDKRAAPVEPKAPENDRVPVFHENFDDDANENSSASGVQRESLANSSFIARMSRRLDFDSPDFAMFNTNAAPENQQRTASPAGERASKSTVEAPSVRISSDQSTARSSISYDTKATSPPTSPPAKHQRGSLTLEPPFQPEGLPKHFSSSASRTSRFSFQMNSEATLAQEKAMEDKGKERAAKARQAGSDAEDGFDDSDDDVTNYGEIDDDIYEEEIPMLNAVDDDGPPLADEHGGTSAHQGNMQAPWIHANQPMQVDQVYPAPNLGDPVRQETQTSDLSVDSMYFDDGLIDDPSPNASKGFDESYFDSPVESNRDDTYHTSPPQGPDIEEAGDPLEVGRGFEGLATTEAPSNGIGLQLSTSTNSGNLGLGVAELPQTYQPSAASLGRLDAYHNALASAATKAEADGRFHRKASVDISVSDLRSGSGSKVSNVSGFEVAPVDWTQSNFDDADFDALEDDQMVAAANAEVLASEDSEFYGQEFGFYAGATGANAEMFSGGFFGAAPDELKRSTSGMNASREPNLTPITERSEFSTRNSFISLQAYGSNQSAPNSAISRNDMSLPSPVLGLKDIAANMNMDEDDMTLSQLIKLRKETFGASGGNTGASPSSGLPSGSPLVVQKAFCVQTVEEEDQEQYSDGWSSAEDDQDDEDETIHQNDGYDPNAVATSQLPSSTAITTLPMRTPPFSSSSEATPKPLSAFKSKSFIFPSQNCEEDGSSPLATPTTALLTSSSTSTAKYFSSASSPRMPTGSHSAPTSPMPMPSPELMQKFSGRPPASSATYAERHRQRYSLQNNPGSGHGDNVAYVMEDSKWYLERRRRMSGGELVVIGRELVEGGTI